MRPTVPMTCRGGQWFCLSAMAVVLETIIPLCYGGKKVSSHSFSSDGKNILICFQLKPVRVQFKSNRITDVVTVGEENVCAEV